MRQMKLRWVIYRILGIFGWDYNVTDRYNSATWKLDTWRDFRVGRLGFSWIHVSGRWGSLERDNREGSRR